MNRKENSGYQRTHRRIQDCLLELVEKKDITKVTVGAVCQAAGINRSTFYAHYQDIYQVLEVIGQELGERLMRDFSAQYAIDHDYFSAEYLTIVLKHMADNRKFYRAYLADSNADIVNRSMELLRTEIMQPYFASLYVTPTDGDYYFNFFKAGFITVVRQWLSNDCPESPEHITKLITNFLAQKD